MGLQLKEYADSALGVTVSGTAEQRHAGFIFKDGADVRILHLAWHFALKRNSVDEYINARGLGPFCAYCCEGLLDSQTLEVVSFLKVIWKRNQHAIPYGIGADGIEGFFNLDGTIARARSGDGLTCATFIMSVFSCLGLSLIDPSDWESRSDDKVWHRWILDNLSQHPAYQPQVAGHAAAQERHVGHAARFRPEEVVGCAAYIEDDPKSFDQAVEAGEVVLADMVAKGIYALPGAPTCA
jgi:hypothetical protein